MPLLQDIARTIAAGDNAALWTGPFDYVFVVAAGAGLVMVMDEGGEKQSGSVPLVTGDYYEIDGKDPAKRITVKNPTAGALAVTLRIGNGRFRKMV